MQIHSRSLLTQNERKLRFMTYVHPTLIVYLRYHVATHEWGLCSQAADTQDAHDAFLHTVPMLIAKTVPVKYVTIGPRDCPFITSS